MTTTRIYIGGLGERVTEDDLRNTFANLGSLQSVDIIRTKGRSFAYINFLPSSDNSLAKLFSTYNGCLWKGGRLKLEKAKEHYTDRLKREWAEDAELTNGADTNHVDDEDMAASAEPKSSIDIEKMQIRIFFPKLRKVKALPLRGTGKHKYSFQRVAAPSLPVHFCDCPEHSNPVDIPKQSKDQKSIMTRRFERETCSGSKSFKPSSETQGQDSIIQDDGMNDEEISVMNSVMKKLFDRGVSSRAKRKDVPDSSQQNVPASDLPLDTNELDDGTDDDDDDDIKINMVAGQNNVRDFSPEDVPTSDFPVDMDELDEGTDDDDLTINMVSGRKKGSSIENEELERSLLSKMAKSIEKSSYNDLATEGKLGNRKPKDKPSNKKRKSLSCESNEKDQASPVSKKKARTQTQSKDSEECMKSLNTATESGPKKLSTQNGVWSQKSAWRELVGGGASSSFSLSHIAPRDESNSDERPQLVKETSSDTKEHEGLNSIVHENLDVQPSEPSKKEEGVLAAQPAGPSTGADKSTKGNSWLQKSSWTQLIGGGNSSSFSISQILPADMVPKQELQKPNANSSITGVFGGTTVKEQRKDDTAIGGSRGFMFGFGPNKTSNAKMSARKGIEVSKAISGSDSKQNQSSPKSRPAVAVGEISPFMRNADSLKDWMTAKAALSNALKKRNNNK